MRHRALFKSKGREKETEQTICRQCRCKQILLGWALTKCVLALLTTSVPIIQLSAKLLAGSELGLFFLCVLFFFNIAFSYCRLLL